MAFTGITTFLYYLVLGLLSSFTMVSFDKISVNGVIDDKNVVTKIMSKYTGLQHIGFNGFAIRHWKTGYYPFAYGWRLGLC